VIEKESSKENIQDTDLECDGERTLKVGRVYFGMTLRNELHLGADVG
jgi:hypothetical protein